MIVQCPDCSWWYDDEFRHTSCPHGTFPANDGKNNFADHPESYLEREPPSPAEVRAPHRWTPDTASRAGRTGGQATKRPKGMGKVKRR